MLPTFLVIGAAKCGTSSLCRLLGSHPDVFMSNPKEPHYFSRLPDSIATPSWYESIFATATGYSALGEGSTSYTSPNRIRRSARRVAQTVPDCKLIYVVRDPISRLESDWKMRFHEGWTPVSINDALVRQPDLLNAGLYWHSISIYREYFADTQLKVVFLEDLVQNPRDVLFECYKHIGVDPEFSLKVDLVVRTNDSAGLREVSPLVRWIVHSRWWHGIRDSIPQSSRNVGNSIFSKKHNYNIEWDQILFASAVAELRDDASQFLHFYGKPQDYWDFASQESVANHENDMN